MLEKTDFRVQIEQTTQKKVHTSIFSRVQYTNTYIYLIRQACLNARIDF